MFVYDPELEPRAADWLDRAEAARRACIARAHARHGWATGADPALHAAAHAVIETALARDRPAGLRQLIAALCGAGLCRHDALHAIAEGFAAVLGGPAAQIAAAVASTVERQLPIASALGTASPGEVLDWLATASPPDALAHTVITHRLGALGAPLLGLLADPQVRSPEHPHAPALAWVAEYFSLMRHPPAIEPTLEALLGTTDGHVAHYQLTVGLPRYGDLAVDALLERLPRFGPDRARVLSSLVEHGARDPRLGPALRAARRQAPAIVAEALRELATAGFVAPAVRTHCTTVDPAALDALVAEFDARIAQAAGDPAAQAVLVAEFEARLDAMVELRPDEG